MERGGVWQTARCTHYHVLLYVIVEGWIYSRGREDGDGDGGRRWRWRWMEGRAAESAPHQVPRRHCRQVIPAGRRQAGLDRQTGSVWEGKGREEMGEDWGGTGGRG